MKPVIIVHGGSGPYQRSEQGRLDGVKAAVREGYKLLSEGRSALDAVEAAVFSLELDDNFDAGYGSLLNIEGEVEMEASIMSGTTLETGAVTLIQDFPNPIRIARKVMTDSPHTLLGGEGAKKFALEKGFKTVPRDSLKSKVAEDDYQWYLKHGSVYYPRKEKDSSKPETEHDSGTVGAVAIDAQGHIAVAGSTGGITGKAPGQISCIAQIGSGTYADDMIGGVALTGHGITISKYTLAHAIIKIMESGVDANSALKQAVTAMLARIKYAKFIPTIGSISLSKDGDVGVHFTSKQMSWAYVKDEKVYCGLHPGQVLEEDL